MVQVAYNKFNKFTDDVLDGKHIFSTHVFKAMLTNTAPTAANAVKADLTEITAGNGYTAGGIVVTVTKSTTSGTAKVTATDGAITASGGSIGPFQHVAIYNDTAAGKPLVCWFTYPASSNIFDGEELVLDFDAAGLFTLA